MAQFYEILSQSDTTNTNQIGAEFFNTTDNNQVRYIIAKESSQQFSSDLVVSSAQVTQQVIVNTNSIAYQTNSAVQRGVQQQPAQYSILQNAGVNNQGQQVYFMETTNGDPRVENVVIEQGTSEQPTIVQPIVLNHQMNSNTGNRPTNPKVGQSQQQTSLVGQLRAPLRAPHLQGLHQQARPTMNQPQQQIPRPINPPPPTGQHVRLAGTVLQQPQQQVMRVQRPPQQVAAGGATLRPILQLPQGVRALIGAPTANKTQVITQQIPVPQQQVQTNEIQQTQAQSTVMKQIPKTVTEYRKSEDNEVSLPDGTSVPLAEYKKIIEQKRLMNQKLAEQNKLAAQLRAPQQPQQQRMPRPPVARKPQRVNSPRGGRGAARAAFNQQQAVGQQPMARTMVPPQSTRFSINNQQPPPPPLPSFQNKLMQQMQQQRAQQQTQQQAQQQQVLRTQQQSQNDYVITPPQPNRPQQQRPLPSYIPSSQIQQIIESTPIGEEFSDSIRMLVLLENGEQRLITFTLPKEACTIKEILEQVNVPFNHDTHIQVTEANTNGINYIVTVGNIPNLLQPTEEETQEIDPEQREAPPLLAAVPKQPPAIPPVHLPPTQQVGQQQQSLTSYPNQAPPQLKAFVGTSQQQLQQPPTPPHLEHLVDESSSQEREASPPKSPTPELPRLVPGKLAVCSYCGITSEDFNRCSRCKRKLPDNIKSIDAPFKTKQSPERTVKCVQSTATATINNVATTVPETSSPPNVPVVNKVTISSNSSSLAKSVAAVVASAKKKVTKQKVVEHEAVVISSDEENDEDDKKPAGVLSNEQILKNLGASVTISPITKEPTLLEMKKFVRRVYAEPNNPNTMGIAIKCRTVRVGSYRFVPFDDVLINAKFLIFKAPQLDNKTCIQTLKIDKSDIVRVLVSFSKALPVVFFYINPGIAASVRNVLNLKEDSDIYNFDPLSEKEDCFKRITLLPEDLNEDYKTIFQEIYSNPNIMEELTAKEANDILIKTCPKDSNMNNYGTYAEIKQLLTYPPEGRGRITINTEDYVCLAQDQFLNDVIIDFYLKYLVNNLSAEEQKKVHVFSTFFYKRLTTRPPSSKAIKKMQPSESDPALTAAEKRHARVKTWTKNVNLFSKDYIVVPINENAHWFLAIICFPSLDGCQTFDGQPYKIEPRVVRKKVKKGKPVLCEEPEVSDKDEAEGDESELDSDCSEEVPTPQSSQTTTVTTPRAKKEPPKPRPPIKQPCILIFDSLSGGTARTRVVATLRDYLTCEYKVKTGTERVYTKDVIKGTVLKVPQQTNFTDCGLYLLQYVEQFFKDPIKDFYIPISSVKNWFEEITVTKKREDIANLIKDLMKENRKDIKMLPDILFPTLNGKLVERCDPDDDEKEECEEEEEDMFTDIEDSQMMDIDTSTNNESPNSNCTLLATPVSSEENGLASQSPLKPSLGEDFSEFVTQPGTLNPDVSELPMRQSSRDTLALLKAKRIIRHKNTDQPDCKRVKSDLQ